MSPFVAPQLRSVRRQRSPGSERPTSSGPGDGGSVRAGHHRAICLHRSSAGAVFLACLAVLAAGCGGAANGGGPFKPVRAGVLTVAAGSVPAPGFWEGTPPRAGFEAALAAKLAGRLGL